jgi:hypothetical protein
MVVAVIRVTCSRYGHRSVPVASFVLLGDGRWGATANANHPEPYDREASPSTGGPRLSMYCRACRTSVPVANMARLAPILTAIAAAPESPAVTVTGQDEVEVSLKLLADRLGQRA